MSSPSDRERRKAALYESGGYSGNSSRSTSPAPTTRRSLPEPPKSPNTMNYQNYVESPQGNPGTNPRQAPPSPSSNMGANGMNGGMGMGAGMGYPTPAGHQSDLNMIMGMVEALSAQLAQNQALTANIVEKTGLVRELAKEKNLTNDEIIALAGKALDGPYRNLDKEISDLQKAFEKTQYDKKEWKKLTIYCCNVLGNILELAHDFKAKHESDTLAWHKNYRKQLADEREENLNLRCQIEDMRAAAYRANDWLIKLRRAITDDEERHELRVQVTQYRQQARFWKRMALKHLPDDDSEFSDDDDLEDPELKKRRLQAEKEAKEAKDKEIGDGGSETSGQ